MVAARTDCRSAMRGGMNMWSRSVFPISPTTLWTCETCILENLLIDRDADGWSVVWIFRRPPCPICFWSCLARARHQFTCVQLSFQRVWSAPNLDSHLISHFLFLHNWNRFHLGCTVCLYCFSKACFTSEQFIFIGEHFQTKRFLIKHWRK